METWQSKWTVWVKISRQFQFQRQDTEDSTGSVVE